MSIVWDRTYNGRPVVRVRNMVANGDGFDAQVGYGFHDATPVQQGNTIWSLPPCFKVGSIHVLAGEDGGAIDRFNICDSAGVLRLTRIALPGDRIEYATDVLLEDDS